MIRTAAALALSAYALTAATAQAALPQGEGVAWEIVADLTTEIGPRLAGSDREAAAREWAVVRLRALGFDNVRIEPFSIPGWVKIR